MDANDIWQLLMKYDREMVSPRFEAMERRFDARFDSMVTRDEFLNHMDRIYKHLERTDTALPAQT